MSIHKPVLLNETIKLLNLKNGSIVVDATLGGGGHSREILKKIGQRGILVGIDADREAIKNFAESFSGYARSREARQFQNQILINDNFANLDKILKSLKIEKADAILADLGWSSDQLSERGMSFIKDEPLDMRLDPSQKLTAREIVNSYSQKELERVIKDYGEEKFWKRIAKKIVESRKQNKIKTTVELAGIVESAAAKGYRYKKINPATKTFQALRIEVNKELENLREFTPQAISALKSGGRLAIISFHSLEDKIVKNIFRENARGCICPETFPQCICGKSPAVKIITKKPIAADEEEVRRNPRSRSAKLRVCEKI